MTFCDWRQPLVSCFFSTFFFVVFVPFFFLLRKRKPTTYKFPFLDRRKPYELLYDLWGYSSILAVACRFFVSSFFGEMGLFLEVSSARPWLPSNHFSRTRPRMRLQMLLEKDERTREKKVFFFRFDSRRERISSRMGRKRNFFP